MQHEIAKPIFVDFELNVAINVSFFKLMKMISNMKMRKGNTLNENKIHNNTYLNNGNEILRSASSFFQYGLYTNLSLSKYIRPVYLFYPKRYDSMNFAISILQQGISESKRFATLDINTFSLPNICVPLQ